MEDQIVQVQAIMSKHGGGTMGMPTNDEDKEELWYSRKAALWATRTLMDDKRQSTLITDVAVPLSRFSEIVSATKKDLDSVTLIYIYIYITHTHVCTPPTFPLSPSPLT